MSALRIYADFNGLGRSCVNPERTAVVLDTFGSLRDLSNAGVVLEPGLPLIAVDASDEDEDLEGHGFVEFDEQGGRYVPAGDRTAVRKFLCVRCAGSRRPTRRCSRTGASVAALPRAPAAERLYR